MVELMNILYLGYCGDVRMNILYLGYCEDGRVDEYIISRILWGW